MFDTLVSAAVAVNVMVIDAIGLATLFTAASAGLPVDKCPQLPWRSGALAPMRDAAPRPPSPRTERFIGTPLADAGLSPPT